MPPGGVQQLLQLRQLLIQLQRHPLALGPVDIPRIARIVACSDTRCPGLTLLAKSRATPIPFDCGFQNSDFGVTRGIGNGHRFGRPHHPQSAVRNPQSPSAPLPPPMPEHRVGPPAARRAPRQSPPASAPPPRTQFPLNQHRRHRRRRDRRAAPERPEPGCRDPRLAHSVPLDPHGDSDLHRPIAQIARHPLPARPRQATQIARPNEVLQYRRAICLPPPSPTTPPNPTIAKDCNTHPPRPPAQRERILRHCTARHPAGPSLSCIILSAAKNPVSPPTLAHRDRIATPHNPARRPLARIIHE